MIILFPTPLSKTDMEHIKKANTRLDMLSTMKYGIPFAELNSSDKFHIIRMIYRNYHNHK